MQTPRDFPLKMQEIILNSDELNVIQVNPPPYSTARKLSDCEIVRAVKIDSIEDRQRLTKAITQGIAEGDDVALCFIPHHALTAKWGADKLEIMVCFECYWIKTSLNEELSNFATTEFPEAIFDSFLPEYAATRDAWKRVEEISGAVNGYSYPIPKKIADDLNRIAECEAWLEENSQIEGIERMRDELQRLRVVLEERTAKA